MITLTLLHPVQGTAVQSWTFKNDQVVRIGRAVDNEVVLYSAVVSRYHVEVRYEKSGWYVHNLGINGTFIEGQKIESEALNDGKMFRLARSGPNIKVSIESTKQKTSQPQKSSTSDYSQPLKTPHLGTQIEPRPNTPEFEDPPIPNKNLPSESSTQACTHERSPKSSLICIDCGEPMNVQRTIGAYKVLKSLGDRETTFQAWKNKKTYILKTAPAELLSDPVFAHTYRQSLKQAGEINYGGIPRIIEVLEFEGQPYLVYEMIYGISVEKWVHDRGRLSLPLAISWITEVARVLEYLHHLNPPIVHQGIQPRNIIRPTIPQGNHHLMLVNVGHVDDLLFVEHPTESDLAYRPPNLAKGEISTNLDLYGLGATFLFMLTGADPYKYIQLEDKAYRLQIEDSPQIPQKAVDLISGLLQTQDCNPITSITNAIDQFLHLI